MRRRNSVEPVIGHLKSDGKMRRCFLKGVLGDALNVLLCACGQNLRKLLRWLILPRKKIPPVSAICARHVLIELKNDQKQMALAA
ncbi:hypothetical protein GCM10011348_29440 [Marinobacterium nitratireducens]|uniref:Transposase DDE domain-containing protein n=1 Tax=Marinobacterium nitratireducens TaxID=518897 RepID=A0A917ZJ98_9GAMM|nr:hypothetical protein GCM10011348_29440 [Marinobacterium nitratireducens]